MKAVAALLALAALALLPGVDAGQVFVPPVDTLHDINDVLVIEETYESGHVVVKLINRAYPDTDTNSYVYIPAELGGSPNIQIVLGDGLKQTGQPLIYLDWLGDRFERSAREVVDWGQRMEALASIGSFATAQALVLTSAGSLRAELAVDVYKTVAEKARAEAMNFFMDIIFKFRDNDQQLPIDPDRPHWIIPPANALVIRIPAQVVGSDTAVITKLDEYRYIYGVGTKVEEERSILSSLQRTSESINAGRTLNIGQIKVQYASQFKASSVETGLIGVTTDNALDYLKRIFDLVLESFGSIVFTLKWQGSDFDLQIIDPDGNIYYGIQAGDNFEAVTIPNATPGVYKIVVIPRDIPEQGEEYTISTISVNTPIEIPDVSVNKTLRIHAREMPNGQMLIFGFVDIEVQNIGNIPITSLEITDNVSNVGAGHLVSSLLKNGRVINIGKITKAYATADNVTFVIDFTKGVLDYSRRAMLKNLTMEYVQQCRALNSRTEMAECFSRLGNDLLTFLHVYRMDSGDKMKISYYVKFFGKKSNLNSEIVADITTLNGDKNIKGKLFTLDT